MKNRLIHFAIHTEDLERAKGFYEKVFNWGFRAYGPSDFAQITDEDSENGELIGALQSRTYSPVEDHVLGFECTIGVENVDEIIAKVEQSGGKVVMPKTAIPHVGWIAKFLDTEGNLVCAMQSDTNAA
ncbi:VOC family protein [Ekhidna sp.]|uniref:VOC family protein n=1 Tax=Ekhidna sp. TaxID=2608089 RepID=UPI003CCBA659